METQGTFVLGGVSFSWSTDDAYEAIVTVSNPMFGSKSDSNGETPQILAHTLARELLAEKDQSSR